MQDLATPQISLGLHKGCQGKVYVVGPLKTQCSKCGAHNAAGSFYLEPDTHRSESLTDAELAIIRDRLAKQLVHGPDGFFK